MIPRCIKAYQDLGVKHEPLTLITPHFETPLPPTQPSVSLFFHLIALVMIFFFSFFILF